MSHHLDQEVRKAIIAHYERFLGKPSQTETLEDAQEESSTFEILEWHKAAESAWVYLTVGASTANRTRAEYMTVMNQCDFDVAIRILGAVYAVATESKTPLKTGHTIQLAEPLENGLGRLLLAIPWGEDEAFERVESNSIVIVMVVPIFESEHAYLRRHGEDALWAAFAEEQVDYTNLSRESVRVSRGIGMQPDPGGVH